MRVTPMEEQKLTRRLEKLRLESERVEARLADIEAKKDDQKTKALEGKYLRWENVVFTDYVHIQKYSDGKVRCLFIRIQQGQEFPYQVSRRSCDHSYFNGYKRSSKKEFAKILNEYKHHVYAFVYENVGKYLEVVKTKKEKSRG